MVDENSERSKETVQDSDTHRTTAPCSEQGWKQVPLCRYNSRVMYGHEVHDSRPLVLRRSGAEKMIFNRLSGSDGGMREVPKN